MKALTGLRVAALVALALLLSVSDLLVRQASATHQPADKIGVSASVMEEMVAQVGFGGGTSGPITLLSATLRTSSPTDLIVQLTGECALWTNVITTEPIATSQAIANVKVWVEIDGVRVPVTSDSNEDGVFNDPDDGKVVFCNRDVKLSTTGLLPGQLLDLFIKTRQANAFNWVTFNVGSGMHTIVVKAQLDVKVSGAGEARAAVGKRTLVIEPA
jgi:hypothetical protein